VNARAAPSHRPSPSLGRVIVVVVGATSAAPRSGRRSIHTQLCHFVGSLEHLIQNQTLMGALSRELTENYKKSPELCYNILRVFLAFSNFLEVTTKHGHTPPLFFRLEIAS
jgi:hypothetical protein